MKISVGQKRSRYTHDKSCINNTTMDFGFVQPTFRALMVRNSDISIKARQFVRLAPMPLPTLADVRVKNVGRFVPMSEVNLAFDPMMSEIPLSDQSAGTATTYNNDFQIYAYALRNVILNLSEFTLYDDGGNVAQIDDVKLKTFNDTYKSSLPITSQVSDITIDGADYIASISGESYTFAFRFTPIAKRLRKIFLGLGYQLTDASTPVSFTPLLAFYKAYFDEYYPKRYWSWTRTNAFSIIKNSVANNGNLQTKDYYNIDDLSTLVSAVTPLGSTTINLFFKDELGTTWATQSQDIVSLAMSSTSSTGALSVPSEDNLNTPNPISSTENKLPTISVGGPLSTQISKVTLDVLRHLTHYVNKDTAVGKRIAEWCKVHYGEDVVNQLYAESHRAGEFITRVDIGDVMSQSDTVNGEYGEYLGSYAGRGVGSDGGVMHYKASEFGIFIVLSHVDVNNRYYQGINPELFAVDRFTYPSSEFDAIGYEVLPKCAVIPNNDISDDASDLHTNEGFGYLPRYSGLKFSQNVINGDLSRRGTISSYSPYTIDKMIVNNYITKDSSGIVYSSNNVPTAGITWQFLGRYDYLSHYNRIFYDVSGDIDNFIVHTAFDAMVGNFLLPMTLSYDTICENDNARVDVAKQ